MTENITINVLLCDTFPGRLPADVPSYVSMHERLLHSVCPGAQFRVFMAMEGQLPSLLNRDEIYLIPGCINSAYDPLPWIADLQRWIRQAVVKGVFLVGVCFGHQLIAQALGGKVEHYAGGWGTGVRQSDVLDADLRQFFPNGKIHLLYNHHDQVISAPREAVTLATSSFCRYEALRVDNHVFTFQGHPEYTPSYMRFYFDHLAAEQDAAVVERGRQSLIQMQPQGDVVARYLLHAFKQYRDANS